MKRELLHFDALKTNKVEIYSTDTLPNPREKLFLTHFGYGEFLNSGFIIWRTKQDSFNPIWFQLHNGDYSPHTFSYIDFNQDGKTDLLILNGEEQYFHSRAFINNSTDHYSPNNFVLKYENNNDYSTLTDIDNDGKPEILDSGLKGNEHNDSPEFFFSTTQKKELTDKYDSITRDKHFNNFTYNMPDHYKTFNSFITDKIIIYQFITDRFVDNTKNFKNYIEWRINFLTELKKDSRNDKELIDKTIVYLRNKIK